MSAQRIRDQLSSANRMVLAKVGHPSTTAEQGRMASVLDPMDRSTNCEDAMSPSSELAREIERVDQADNAVPCAIAPAWLKDAECA